MRRHTIKHAVWVILVILVFVAPPQKGTLAGTTTQRPPKDFALESSALGVELYKSEGNKHFVQVIDLSLGASVELLHGPKVKSDWQNEPGAYGGFQQEFRVQSLQDVWKEFSSSNSRAFCISNGQFFLPGWDPTRLSFPLKKDGELKSGGCDLRPRKPEEPVPGDCQPPGADNSLPALMLEIWENSVSITELSKQALASSDAADNIIGSLDERIRDADKGVDQPRPRTFIGVADCNDDMQCGTLLILNSRAATAKGAADILRKFGAKKVMMLDGGGSTQLICRKKGGKDPYISSSRRVPQFLAVAAALPRRDSAVVRGCDEVTLRPGEAGEIAFELRNTGNVPWEPEQGYALINTNQQTLGASPRQTLVSQVATGEPIDWGIPITAPLEAGSYMTNWQMAWNEERFGSEVSCSVSVREPMLERIKRKLGELWEKVKELVLVKLSELWENLMQRLEEWVQRELQQVWREFWEDLLRQCCGANVLAPATLLLAAVGINRKRRGE